MKISKLFHWLYAILMLLPICGVFFKVGYVMLNENAYQSYSGTYAYNGYAELTDDEKADLTPLSSVPFNYTYGSSWFFINDNTNWYGSYLINLPQNTNFYFARSRMLLFYNLNNIRINNVSYDNANTLFIGNINNSTQTMPYVFAFYLEDLDNLSIAQYSNCYLRQDNIQLTPIASCDLSSTSCTLEFNKTDRFVYSLGWAFDATTLNLSSLVNYIQRPLFVYDNTLSSVFYSSLQELDNTEFFSWAKDSFLVQPIMYVGNLFGITSPHPIFTLMSYWLAISIIWLVFDLVMYLPLLVHRWLDKGVIE